MPFEALLIRCFRNVFLQDQIITAASLHAEESTVGNVLSAATHLYARD